MANTRLVAEVLKIWRSSPEERALAEFILHILKIPFSEVNNKSISQIELILSNQCSKIFITESEPETVEEVLTEASIEIEEDVVPIEEVDEQEVQIEKKKKIYTKKIVTD